LLLETQGGEILVGLYVCLAWEVYEALPGLL